MIGAWLSSLLVVSSLIACGDDDTLTWISDRDGGIGEEPSRGTAVVERAGVTKRLTHWTSRFTIRENPNESDTHELDLMISAEGGGDTFNVYVMKRHRFAREPFSLVGSYDIRYEREPSSSGSVYMMWDDEELFGSDVVGAASSGALTISEHVADRIEGSVFTTLDDGSAVMATINGRIAARCDVAESEPGSWEQAPLDHPFCAPYFE